MHEPSPVEKFVERITILVGSVPSLVVHSIAFVAAFAVAVLKLAPWDTVLLVLTTVVSLEAIYISILIQITVNRQARELHAVSADVEDIQEDIEEISEDVEEIAEDVEEMTEDWDLETGEVQKAEQIDG